ncbi:MAG: aminotransferase class V-fold PLP-dependent enzyme, partial [Steroidobacteraceae bacterium]
MAAAAVYLDHAATTPVDPRVAEAMRGCLTADGVFGNPASATHEFGRAAAARVARGRERVARLIGGHAEEIVFTSGATEANNLALLGVLRANRDRGRHLVTFRTEHKSVIDPAHQLEKEGFLVTWLTPDRGGSVDPGAIRAAIRDETLLVSVMHVNNEIGVIADVAAIGAICRERNVLFHTDASQSVGRVPVNVRAIGADLLSLTAHKIYGPKGIGALWVGERARPWLKPLLFGGGQERGLRPGTLATHQIEGLGMASELAGVALAAEPARLRALRERLWTSLAGLGGVHRNGAAEAAVANILNLSFEGVEGDSLVAALGGVAVSTGSACTSALREPSFVLRALGRSAGLAQSSLRFSLGRPTTAEEIDRAAASVRAAVEWLRAIAPGGPVQP